MTRLWAALLAILPTMTAADTIVDLGTFRLDLKGDWVQSRSPDQESVNVSSRTLDTHLTLSVVRMNAKREDTERIAGKLREFRLNGEQAAAREFNLRMTIAEPVVVPFAQGHQVAYFGHDSKGRQFRYLGIVVPTQTVNLYAESPTRSQQELESIFNELLKGLQL